MQNIITNMSTFELQPLWFLFQSTHQREQILVQFKKEIFRDFTACFAPCGFCDTTNWQKSSLKLKMLQELESNFKIQPLERTCKERFSVIISVCGWGWVFKKAQFHQELQDSDQIDNELLNMFIKTDEASDLVSLCPELPYQLGKCYDKRPRGLCRV